jgi:hypothetical protein
MTFLSEIFFHSAAGIATENPKDKSDQRVDVSIPRSEKQFQKN